MNTTATTAQSTSSSEALSGNITLHKVAKTGTYSDLIDTPTIENFYFVQGTSSAAGNSTSGSYLSTKWEGTIPGVSAATDGLKIAYRIATNTGVSSAGVVLSIDGTNYYPVVIQKNTMVTTHYPVGTTVLMVFNSTQTATGYLTSGVKSTITGCWQIMEYDSNTNTQQRLYVSTGNTEYPITTRYNITTGETYYAEYGRYAEGVTLNPSTNAITASKFKVSGGTSSQFLKADGSVDSNTYLTSYTETDPVFLESAAAEISLSDIINWDSKTSNIGTITSVKMNGSTVASSGEADLGTVITSETSLSKGTGSGSGNAVTDISVSGHQITLTKGKTFLESETDPVFSASAAAGITSSDITN